MRFSQKYYCALVGIGILLISGCVKFDDPPVVADSVIYVSPCTSELTNNQVVYTFMGSSYDPMILESVEITDDGIYCTSTSTSASVEILLSAPLDKNGIYSLHYPSVADGEAQIKITPANFYPSRTFRSDSGELYVQVQEDGSAILEWCEIHCKVSSTNNSSIVSSGRVVVD